MCILLLFIGLISLYETESGWGIGSLLLIFTLAYDTTIGPVCYSLVSEMSSTRLKIKTMVIARVLYNVVGIVVGFVMPYMLSPTGWDWKGKAGFFWCGVCLLCWVWTYYRLPEPRGRTYAELDILFERGVDAREFAKTEINIWTAETPQTETEEVGSGANSPTRPGLKRASSRIVVHSVQAIRSWKT